MSEKVLDQCDVWAAKNGESMQTSGLRVLLQELCQLSDLEISLLCESFGGVEAEGLQLVPFMRWLLRLPGPPRAPEQSGVPLREFMRLVTEHEEWLSTARWNPVTHCSCRPNMYDVVARILKPRTKARQVAYAELLEPLAPNVFVSHWWGEEFICFVTALRLFASVYVSQTHSFDQASFDVVLKQDDEKDVSFWVCSFANRQWEVNLGNTLQESPFERALSSPCCTHVVMIMDPAATPLCRIWCLYEVLRTHALKKTFHIATENGVLTFGSSEPRGQLREDLLTLTKRTLEIDASTAQASQEHDRRMIMEEVDQAVGLEQFGMHVMSLLMRAFRTRGGEQLAMNAPELKHQFFRLGRLVDMFVTYEGRTVLHKVAQRKDANEVQLALAAADLQELISCNSLGQTPLHLAAAYNRNVGVLRLLINAQMDVNGRDQQGLTPWMLSAATGNHEALSWLLSNGADRSCDADLWQSSSLPWTSKVVPDAVSLAAFSGSAACCKALLRQTARVHMMTLSAASVLGNVEVLEVLLPYAEDINGCFGPVPTPLLSASFCGHIDCADLLLKNRALPDKTSQGGKTPFFCAMSAGYEEIGRLLLRFDADPWIKPDSGDTALTVASGGGHDGCVRMLLTLRAALNETCGDHEFTPLHVAAEWGRKQTVRLLVESRADQNAENNQHETPLHRAAEYGYADVLAVLLEMRADPQKRDIKGMTALEVATHEGMEEAMEFLRSAL